MSHNVPKPTIAILTAMSMETSATIKLLKNKTNQEYEKYYYGEIPGKNGNHKVLITSNSYGTEKTALAAQELLHKFNSIQAIIFLGVAGGTENKSLGDVIISHNVTNPEQAKYLPGGKKIHRGYRELPSALLLDSVDKVFIKIDSKKMSWKSSLIKFLKKSSDKKQYQIWSKFLEAHIPEIGFGTLGSSLANVNDKKKRDNLAKELGITAFEMEGSGLATFVWNYHHHKLHYLIIRGVSDKADLYSRDDEAMQPYAAHVATAFLQEFLKELPIFKEDEASEREYQKILVGENSIYEMGMDIAKKAKTRLIIIQRTPSLLFGANKKHTWDSNLIKLLHNCATRTINNENYSFYYLYLSSKTKQKISDPNMSKLDKLYLIKHLRENLKKYKNIENKSNQRFRIDSIPTEFAGPLALGDNVIAFWLAEEGEGKKRKMLVPAMRSKQLSDGMYDELKGIIPTPSSLKELLDELGIQSN